MTFALGTLMIAFCASYMLGRLRDTLLKCHVLSSTTHTHTQTQDVMPDLVHCLLEKTTRLLLGGTCPHGQGCAQRPCQLVPWLHTASCAVVACMTA